MTGARPTREVVTVADRPDLVPLVADWLWRAFWRDAGATLDHVRTLVAEGVARRGPPQCFVLLDGGEPVGTASLAASDLDARPDLTPWLAGVYVEPAARNRGCATALVGAVEAAAREASVATLWLYTATAERLYARAGWRTVDSFDHGGRPNMLMRRDLDGAPLNSL